MFVSTTIPSSNSLHSGPFISKTPWKPQIIVKSLSNLKNNLSIWVNPKSQ